MDYGMMLIASIVSGCYIIAMISGILRVHQIDKELQELEKLEPGYRPGYTNIPGPM